MLRPLTAVAALSLSLLVPAAPSPGQAIDTLALRAHTRFLAHDLLEGRGTGTRGEHLAALYIASQLEALGVPGAGPGGTYFQALPLRRATAEPAVTRAVLDAGGEEFVFRLGADFVWSRGGAGAFRPFEGPTLFVGIAELAGAATASAPDIAGRVIVVLGALGREAGPLVTEWIRRDAAGVVMLLPEEEQYRAFAASGGGPHTYIAAEVDEPLWQPNLPMIVGGPALTRALLAGAPLTVEDFTGGRPFPALDLDRKIRVDAAFRHQELEAANVAAMVPGSDAGLGGETVVYTAHYDHLGIGTPDASGDSIYNGFSDNAAGTAMLLDIARVMAASPPARSVLFLFFTGEELGLLGSTFYVTEPLVPLDSVVAVINLDGGAPPAPPARWRIAGGDASSLGETAAAVAAARGWTAEPSPASPNSDHWPFLRRGIPAIFVIPGLEWEGVGAAQHAQLSRRWDRYHQPSDEWHPDFPFRGLQRYAELAYAIGRAVADERQRPEWFGM